VSDDRIQKQNYEFKAVDHLASQWRRLQMTAVVDDDYPAVRHDYESALAGLINSMRTNDRFGPGNRYRLVEVQ
jgi:hypothetical protein